MGEPFSHQDDSALDGHDDALLVMGQDGTAVFVDQAAAALLGCGAQDTVGQPLEKLLPELTWAQVAACTTEVQLTASCSCGALLGVTVNPGRGGQGKGFALHLRCLGRTDHDTFFKTLMDNLPCPVFFKDEHGVYLGCNQAFEDFFGRPRSDLVGKSVYDFSPHDLAEVYHAMDQELFDQGIGAKQIYDTQVQRADGSRRDVVFHKANFGHADGRLGGLIGIILDVTDRHRAEAEARAAKEQLQKAIDSISESFALYDAEDRLTLANRQFYTMFHILGGAEGSLGRTFDELIRTLHAHQQLLSEPNRPVAEDWIEERLRAHREAVDQPHQYCLPDGRWLQEREYRTQEGSTVVVQMDITLIKEQELALHEAKERAEHLALHDELTGLANRALFHDRLRLAKHRVDRMGDILALLYIDLNDFKIVNDRLGHAAGDQCLQQVAQRLGTAVRESDTLARVGGDEFAVVAVLKRETCHVEAADIAQRMLTSLASPLSVDGKAITIGASVGISSYPCDSRDVDSLVRHADSAMYQAKDSKQPGWFLYCDQRRADDSSDGEYCGFKGQPDDV